jgi:FtsP/CotA-like multicopper oxidase with cupredoxin domain
MLLRTLLSSLIVLSTLGTTGVSAQEREAHMGMEMSNGWRMVPMEMSMPTFPGLEGAVPIVGPFLPGMTVDASSLPMAQPSRVVPLGHMDTLDISVSMVRRDLNGQEVVMYGYNGQHPGPLIQADQGTTVVVRVTNDIEMPTTIHWHGVRIENQFDGVPGVTQAAIQQGETYTHEVRVPDAGMFWYHPHTREDVQQDLGLFGNLLVTSPDADYYGPANREEVLVLDDILMDDQGLIPYGDVAPTHALMGRFGNVMLVNGETDYTLKAERGEVVRFHLTNVANTRTFNVGFGNAQVKVVASDVGRFEREQWVSSVVIAPAERYTVDVRFTRSGQVAITNNIQAINHFMGEFYSVADTLALVDVSRERVDEDHGEAFGTLREHAQVIAEIDEIRDQFDRAPDHRLEATVRVSGLPRPIVRMMEVDTLYLPPMEWNDAMPMMNWLSTAEQVQWILRDRDTGAENMDIDWEFDVGDVVKVQIFNSPDSFHPMHHPVHFHGQRFLVLSMDGVETQNLVWKDTAIVPVGSTAEFLIEMSNPGVWMAHCHIAEHLHAGMMFSFTVNGT